MVPPRSKDKFAHSDGAGLQPWDQGLAAIERRNAAVNAPKQRVAGPKREAIQAAHAYSVAVALGCYQPNVAFRLALAATPEDLARGVSAGRVAGKVITRDRAGEERVLWELRQAISIQELRDTLEERPDGVVTSTVEERVAGEFTVGTGAAGRGLRDAERTAGRVGRGGAAAGPSSAAACESATVAAASLVKHHDPAASDGGIGNEQRNEPAEPSRRRHRFSIGAGSCEITLLKTFKLLRSAGCVQAAEQSGTTP